MPLDADVEQSPFPTLEEIEQISNEKAQAVHGHRPMPVKSNPTWKKEQSDGEEAAEEMDDDEVRFSINYA